MQQGAKGDSSPHILIIGNGVAGTTLGRHVRKLSDAKITILSDETDHFFSRTALMYIYMGHMSYQDTKPYEDKFWEKNRISLMRGRAVSIDTAGKKVRLRDGQELKYDSLVLALGSSPNKFGWPGQDLKGVQGLYHYQDLEKLEQTTARGIQHGVIVGGGLIGIELAEMLLSRNIPVSFLVREKLFWNGVLPKEEAELITRHIRAHHVDLQLETELKEILSDEQGWVKGVTTSKGQTLPCQFVGLTAGVHPNVAWLKDHPSIEVGRGIKVDRYLETSAKDVYAIGDCVELREAAADRRAIEQVWYTGKIMGETLARTLVGQATPYQQGIWFNSAKFFDIEYQTYGQVPAQTPTGVASFVWQDSEKDQLVRLNFDAKSRALLGINNFGLRLRHAVCEQWIANKASVDEVLLNFGAANFDPEFFQAREADILASFRESAYGHFVPEAALKTSKGLFSRFFA